MFLCLTLIKFSFLVYLNRYLIKVLLSPVAECSVVLGLARQGLLDSGTVLARGLHGK